MYILMCVAFVDSRIFVNIHNILNSRIFGWKVVCDWVLLSRTQDLHLMSYPRDKIGVWQLAKD